MPGCVVNHLLLGFEFTADFILLQIDEPKTRRWQGSTSACEADRDHFQGHAQESETVAPCGLFRPNHALQVSETFGGKSFDFFAVSMFP